MTARLRKIDHDERGASAVELAIIAPVVMLLVVGVVEFGVLLNRIQVFEGAAREGARAAAVRENPAAVRGRVQAAAGTYAGLLPGPGQISVAVAGGGAQCTEATRGNPVTVSWTQPLSNSLNFPLFPGFSVTRSIAGVFRCE